MEREIKGIGCRKIKCAISLSDAHHFKSEIGGNHIRLRESCKSFTCQVPCSSAEIEQTRIPIQPRQFHYAFPPADILPTCYQSIHEIVTFGDFCEHTLNVASAFFTGQLGHEFSCSLYVIL